jgi:hypothetical protein
MSEERRYDLALCSANPQDALDIREGEVRALEDDLIDLIVGVRVKLRKEGRSPGG